MASVVATLEPLAPARRAEIAGLIGRRADRSSVLSLARSSTLAESFPIAIWTVDPDRELEPLATLAEPTDRWHHQVVQPSGDPYSARTIEGDGSSASALMLGSSVLAAKLHAAIDWADAHVDDSWTARLLFVPKALLYCLWFERDGHDRLYVVDAPIRSFEEGTEIEPVDVMAFVKSHPCWEDDGQLRPFRTNEG